MSRHLEPGDEPGVFFAVGPFGRKTHRVLVEGRERTDYRLFFEFGGQCGVMIYFERMTYAERCSFQIQQVPRKER